MHLSFWIFITRKYGLEIYQRCISDLRFRFRLIDDQRIDNMWKVAAGLFLLICLVSADDHGSEAITHTAESFATEVETKKHFVMFFAPW